MIEITGELTNINTPYFTSSIIGIAFTLIYILISVIGINKIYSKIEG